MSVFDEIIADYLSRHREDAVKELRWFEIQRTFEKTLSLAAFAEDPRGKRFPHQRRIPKSVLTEAHHRLHECMPELRQCKNFEEPRRLFGLTNRSTRTLPL